MNRINRHILFLLLLIALLAISTSVVLAKELGLLTISGPGIKGELTLKDPNDTMKLEQSGFFDEASLSKPPKNVNMEAGYNITAHLNLDGKLVPMAQMVYYPMEEGQAGYLHYTGRLDGETLRAVDEWHLMSLSADNSLRGLLTTNNVTVQSALIAAPKEVSPAKEPVMAPAVEPAAAPAASAIQPSYIVPAVIAAILLLAGAGLALRRRPVNHPAT